MGRGVGGGEGGCPIAAAMIEYHSVLLMGGGGKGKGGGGGGGGGGGDAPRLVVVNRLDERVAFAAALEPPAFRGTPIGLATDAATKVRV